LTRPHTTDTHDRYPGDALVFRRLFSRRPTTVRSRTSTRLRVEWLEAREVPAVNVLSIGAQEMASDRSFFLPITVTNTPGSDYTTTVDTNSSAVTGTVLAGRTLAFNVTNAAGVNGTLTIQLFDDVAPVAAQRMVDLVTSGFYNGKTFFRIDDLFSAPDARTNFIIQGGGSNNTDNSTLGSMEEEFNLDYTFASNGLVAMAKTAIPDTSNSQFFITDLNRPVAERVEFLNHRYTIVGMLTGGADVFEAMKAAPRTGTQPGPAIVITSASVVANSPNRVIKFTPAAGGFSGTTSVTVTSNDADNTPTNTTFNLSGVADPNNTNPPFLNPVPNTMTATAGQPTTLTLSSADRDGGAVAYAVKDVNFTGDPANLSFSINQTNGVVTLTPAAGFTGTIQFKVGVRQADAADTPSNYAAQLVTMTVNAPVPGQITAEGSPAGSEPRVTVRNSDGSQRFSILVFEQSFTGGVAVSVADVTGDGTPDVIAVPGFGGAPLIKVLNGTDGSVLSSKMIFEDTFRGGLNLEVADARNLGYSQILVGAGNTGGPRVTLFDAKTNQSLLNFFAADPETRGGVSVDVGAVDATHGTLIVTGGGQGNGPVVNAYRATTGTQAATFLAGEAGDRAGIRVRIGDTVDSSFNAKPVFVAPYFSTGTADEDKFNIVPFLT
jgi:cyclophilin family peptidyl-prolyl cis-trans isomerase